MNKDAQDFINRMNKEHGAGAVIQGNTHKVEVDVISTGSLKIDVKTGIGGIPKGRITEVFGQESSGKSTLALQAVANSQKKGGLAAYIDVEHAIDPTYAKNLGVNLEDLVFSQPDNAEQGLSILKEALRAGIFDIIVLDSVGSLTPKAVIDGEVGDAHVGILARLMSKNLSMFSADSARANTALLLLNQTRNKIGVMYGSPLTTMGGDALKFYASLRIQMTRSTLKKDGEDAYGNEVKVRIVKNKLAAPFQECEPEIIYGEGFSLESEVIDLGSELQVVEKAGSWYSYKGERIGQGKDNARQFLAANPAILKEIEEQVRSKLGVN